VCRTINKNLSVFKSSIGSGRTNENNGIYKREACVARKHMKKRAFEEKRFWRSSEAVSSKAIPLEANVIRSWRSSEAEVWKLKLVKCCHFDCTSLQKEWEPEATAISEELEGIGCLSTEERKKRTIVQLYNHYLNYSVFVSAIVQDNSCDYAGNSPFKEWIWNYSLLGQ